MWQVCLRGWLWACLYAFLLKNLVHFISWGVKSSFKSEDQKLMVCMIFQNLFFKKRVIVNCNFFKKVLYWEIKNLNSLIYMPILKTLPLFGVSSWLLNLACFVAWFLIADKSLLHKIEFHLLYFQIFWIMILLIFYNIHYIIMILKNLIRYEEFNSGGAALLYTWKLNTKIPKFY